MSAYYNDYIIASHNSINENKYNSEKLAKSPSYKIKKILKPILRILRKKNKNSSISSAGSSNNTTKTQQSSLDCFEYQPDFWSSEIEDNLANEELEARILDDIAHCEDDAAIYVYNNDECELQAVERHQTFVPVHFARTEAGTFFWTTMQRTVDYEEPSCCYNLPHSGDRWVQA